MSHWQNVGQDVCAEASRTESSRRDGMLPQLTYRTDCNERADQLHLDQSISKRNNAKEALNIRLQEPRGEKNSFTQGTTPLAEPRSY